jgi:hypothetical protein
VENNDLNLIVEPSLVREFYGLLQAGFTIQCQLGTSVENLFFEQLGLDAPLVEKKISTIFLNGKPVDDITATIIHDGSTLALSGAMPGLVGATLRRKSPLASFRQSINAAQGSAELQKTKGYIQIKLFNILLDELGSLFLEMGIFVQTDALISLLTQLSNQWNMIRQTVVNGNTIQTQENAEWLTRLSNHNYVHLKVSAQK